MDSQWSCCYLTHFATYVLALIFACGVLLISLIESQCSKILRDAPVYAYIANAYTQCNLILLGNQNRRVEAFYKVHTTPLTVAPVEP